MTSKHLLEEAAVAPEVKKVDHFAKGIAPIKPEYLVVDAPAPSADYHDDEAEGGDRQHEPAADGKKGKRRGQNKKRDLRQQHEQVRLCSSLVDPQGGECTYGGKCRNFHDVPQYLQQKPEDIPGVCPVFEAIGYCPLGLKCRWLGSHYDAAANRLVRDDARAQAAAQAGNFEVNKLSPESKLALQRKKYDFGEADSVVAYLDSLVKNEKNAAKAVAAEAAASAQPNVLGTAAEASAEAPADGSTLTEPPAAAAAPASATPAERTKLIYQAYHDAPYKLSEKKRLNLHRAKIVSPLTTVGNLPYRRLMKTLGADVTYSEMALALPLIQGHNAEWALPKAHRSEYPGFGVQIATAKHWAATKAAAVVARETSHVSELNLNCGCPIDLLYRQGQGLALMEQPARLVRILEGMAACLGDIPVTVKLRTGTKDGHNTASQLVLRLLGAQLVAAVTLHGRSRQQRYTREADWDYVRQVAQVVQCHNDAQEDAVSDEHVTLQRVQFVGNGDVYTFEDWHNAVLLPGVDSVMVARGALIKPWIFEEVEAQQYLDKLATERLAHLEQFAKFAIEHWGSDEYGVGLARRFMCEFLSFTHRYIPVGIMERLPAKLNQRPPQWRGRNELETLLGLRDYRDWIKITEMFLGKASKDFAFVPKHKSNAG